jgi:hypothetical protein
MPPPDHPVFTPPENRHARIWRYMDFTKYLSMLETKALFFCRVDKLGDPFEGTLSRATLEAWRTHMKEFNLEDSDMPLQWARPHRRWTFVNWWHLAEDESAAMWKLYSKSNEAIAIRSTYARLAGALPNPYSGAPDQGRWIYMGVVYYIDYDFFRVPPGNTMAPFVYKRKSFEHEREVRALIQEVPIVWINGHESIDVDFEPRANGKNIAVDISALIEKVFIAPDTPDWYFDLVSKVTRRYGFDFEVRRSRLDEDPLL